MSIRLDTYEMVNVESVVVGGHGHDVTCIVTLEGGEAATPEWCAALGLGLGAYR